MDSYLFLTSLYRSMISNPCIVPPKGYLMPSSKLTIVHYFGHAWLIEVLSYPIHRFQYTLPVSSSFFIDFKQSCMAQRQAEVDFFYANKQAKYPDRDMSYLLYKVYAHIMRVQQFPHASSSWSIPRYGLPSFYPQLPLPPTPIQYYTEQHTHPLLTGEEGYEEYGIPFPPHPIPALPFPAPVNDGYGYGNSAARSRDTWFWERRKHTVTVMIVIVIWWYVYMFRWYIMFTCYMLIHIQWMRNRETEKSTRVLCKNIPLLSYCMYIYTYSHSIGVKLFLIVCILTF